MLDKINVEWSVQAASTPFDIFMNKGHVEAMLNESLNQFEFDSTHFQHFLCFKQC